MSTMKVTTLKNEASSVDNIVLNSDGSVGGELATTLASKLDLCGWENPFFRLCERQTAQREPQLAPVPMRMLRVSSVTITPQKSRDSAILIYLPQATYRHSTRPAGTKKHHARLRITDSSDNPISGATDMLFGADQTWRGCR